ncbi:uncharacterized protein TRAVEDRAFT_37380 [Trametes versicolor FP-101664 SS1]|uniref:uncharacterized protein n=1 Tax=Trametes versicolor (strain FP-101664) TaxID=717944 RepID=UPI0004624677|nr:uncharacterized protein TRAVEDRAFT_37380 [Trametes versicolor FP-101664 SS1]EIW58463.1 hypothetical protein TRAVEDRAFT_37380 [Trametes versicolor FP-101664 SS1]
MSTTWSGRPPRHVLFPGDRAVLCARGRSMFPSSRCACRLRQEHRTPVIVKR